MTDGRAKRPPGEALVDLRRRLAVLPARDPLRKEAVAEAAAFFGITTATLHRCLREQLVSCDLAALCGCCVLKALGSAVQCRNHLHNAVVIVAS